MAEFEVTLTTDDVVASDGLSIFQDKGISDDSVLSDFLRMEFFEGTLEPSLSHLITFEEVSVQDEVALVFSKNPTDLVSVSDQIVAQLVESLSIDDVRALNSKTIRIDFDRPTINNEALRDPDSYSFLPVTPGAVPIIPQSVEVPVSQANPLFVTIEVTEQTDGATYSAQLVGAIQGVNGEPPDAVAQTFTGIGTTPQIALVLAIDKNTVEVQFTEAMLDNDSIRDLARYSFDPFLEITEIESVIDKVVTLKTADQVPGTLYTLTVLGADFLTSSDSDTVSVVDSVQAEVTTDLIQVSVSDSVSTSDQIATELFLTIEIVYSETIQIADDVEISFATGASQTDSISVTDQLFVTTIPLKGDSVDAIVVTDQIQREHDALRDISDSITTLDVANVSRQRDVVVSDLIATVDQIVSEPTLGAEDSDSVAVADQIAREATFERQDSDSIATADSTVTELTGGPAANQVVIGSGEEEVVYGSGGDTVIAGS